MSPNSPDQKTKAEPSKENEKPQLATPKRLDARAEALRANLRKRKEWAKSMKDK